MTVPRRVLDSFSDQLSKRLAADAADSKSSIDDASSAADPVAVSWYASPTSVCAVVSDTSRSEEWCLHYLFSFRESFSGGSAAIETKHPHPATATISDSNRLQSAGSVSLFNATKPDAPLEKLISAEWPKHHQAAEKFASKSLGTWLAIPCDRNRPASHLLDSLPQIPPIVATDWRKQLRTLESELGCEERSLRPDEVWVAPDGRLIPLGQILRRLSADRSRDSECETIRSKVNAIPALWPWESHKMMNGMIPDDHSSSVVSQHAVSGRSHADISSPKDSAQVDISAYGKWLDPSANAVAKSRPSNGRNAARKERDRKRKMAIAAVAAVIVVGMVAWFVWPTENRAIKVATSNAKSTSNPNADANADVRGASSTADTQSTPSGHANTGGTATGEIATSDHNQREAEELTMIETDDVMTESSAVSKQPSLDQLLGQLNMSRPVAPVSISPESSTTSDTASIAGDASSTNRPSTVSVDASRPSITADEIIRGTLQSSDRWRDSTATNSDSAADATTDGGASDVKSDETAESSQSPLSSDANAETSDSNRADGDSKNGPRQLNLKLADAKNKETISIGTRVVTKNASLTASVQLPEPLVIEPNEAVTIPGSDFISWKVALEDVEPELVVELHSKPGMRWQVTALIGVRLQRNAAPIPLGPNDAQLVGNRLLLYSQWLNQSIDSLREARSNRQSRGPRIDYTTQIRMLEVEKRETEEAIKIWESIARLSHLIYSGQQIAVTLLPAANSTTTTSLPSVPSDSKTPSDSETSSEKSKPSEPLNENR